MGYVPLPAPPPPQGKEQILLGYIEKGDCQAVRNYFDQLFWKNEKFVPAWDHLEVALKNKDRTMMRLLITRGAAPDKTAALRDDQVVLLRRCGLPKDHMPAQGSSLSAGTNKTYAGSSSRVPDQQVTEAETMQPGQTIPGKGVYIGTWTPMMPLGKTFNVFAAPEDLTDMQRKKIALTYNDTVRHVARLKNWHGHDGGEFEDNKAIYKALKNGSYNGEWFIPVYDILEKNFYPHQNEGDLKNTFSMTAREDVNIQGGFKDSVYYWSSTEHSDTSLMFSLNLSVCFNNCHRKDHFRFYCRPVRVEPQEQPPFPPPSPAARIVPW